jgi:subtilisin family serine protease
MKRTIGRPEVTLGLIDGPVLLDHPDLTSASLHQVPGTLAVACSVAASVACGHGTFVASVLVARRGSAAPAICPGCTLLVRPIFSEAVAGNGTVPSATAMELAAAIVESVDAGARVLNMSAALVGASPKGEQDLASALDYAGKRGAIAIAAAGNQATVGSSVITRHPWVIPVAACDQQGKPTAESNLGATIGRRGIRAPGENISGLGTDGKPCSFGGTSAAAPFVTGAVALLWSEFPAATAAHLRHALTTASLGGRRPNTVVPPLLNAWAAYLFMSAASNRTQTQ